MTAGWRVMARQAVLGGVILGVIEGLGIVLTKYGAQPQMVEPPGLNPFGAGVATPPTAPAAAPSYSESFPADVAMEDDVSLFSFDSFSMRGDDSADDFTSAERFT